MQWNNKSLEKLAERYPEIASELKTQDVDSTYLQLNKVCKLLHIMLWGAPLKESGVIGISQDDKKRYGEQYNCSIIVNSTEEVRRTRFTIAHEIGHFCYDFEEIKNRTIIERRAMHSYNADELTRERRANAFAAELLMPEIFFRRLFDLYWQENSKCFIEKLADHFNVSETAIGIRLATLGLL